jgi:hypothetical protein
MTILSEICFACYNAIYDLFPFLFVLWTLSLVRNILEERIRKEQPQVGPPVANSGHNCCISQEIKTD